jgi:hypothetical protein
MTYATSNQPYRLSQGGLSGASLWYYSDGDVDSDVDATDYFSDGDALGMKVGDMLLHYDTAGVATFFFVSAVTAGGAATVIAGTVTV